MEKIDTELALALSLNKKELAKNKELEIGYNESSGIWELFIKYSGNPENIEKITEARVVPLLNNYGIIYIPETKIQRLNHLNAVEYVEKPKALLLSAMEGVSTSCIGKVQLPPFALSGAGVYIAIIDSGIDFRLPEFIDKNGRSRVVALWEQDGRGNAPEPYGIGREYKQEELTRLIQENEGPVDYSGHGTQVAAIAAANGAGRGIQGVAPESELIIVKLGSNQGGRYPQTLELIQGIDWCVRKALEGGKPLALNLSFGNNYGSHRGDGLLGRYIQGVAGLGKQCFVVGMGNEGNARKHSSLHFSVGRNEEKKEVLIGVGQYESGINIQIWHASVDDIVVGIQGPGGESIEAGKHRKNTENIILGSTQVIIWYGTQAPFSTEIEILIALLPVEEYIESGIWKLVVKGENIRLGRVDLWLPVAGITNEETYFLNPDPLLSLTVPGDSYGVISVGAYDSRTDSYAAFSGRGGEGGNKPDLVAPGVSIETVAPEGRSVQNTGTSFAAPFVTGSAALLMEWGIVQGRDPYLYGEALRTQLIKGARPLPGYKKYPNPQVGWGALCLENSIPASLR